MQLRSATPTARPSTATRQTPRARRETERQVSPVETHEGVRPARDETVEATLVPPNWFVSVPPPTDEEHAEAAWEAREAARRRRKGRYQVRSMRM